MTNIYLTDNEAIVYFVKDHEELFDTTNQHFNNKQEKSVSGRSSPTVASSLSRLARRGLTCRGHIMAN